MGLYYKITVYYAHGIRFTFKGPKYTESKVEQFEAWASGKSKHKIMVVQDEKENVFLNRELMCAMTVEVQQ